MWMLKSQCRKNYEPSANIGAEWESEYCWVKNWRWKYGEWKYTTPQGKRESKRKPEAEEGINIALQNIGKNVSWNDIRESARRIKQFY